MKKVRLILLIILLLSLLTSCFNNDRYNLDESVIAPTINNLSLEGSWIVVEKYDIENTQKLPTEDFDNIYINDELVEIGNIYTLKPKFESKYLNTNNYFGSDIVNVGYSEIIDRENIEVIIISDEDGFYQEIVKLSGDYIYIVFNKTRYLLEKKSEEVEEMVLQKYKDGSIKTNKESFYGKLGLNITIKNQNINDLGNLNTYYKTYYIHYDNSSTNEMTIKNYHTENIFLSKKDTFNLIKYDEQWNANIFSGKLSDYIILGKENIDLSSQFYSSNIPFELTYISSKYYSIISNDEKNPSNKQYRIKEINGKKNDLYLNIEDIAGEEGYKIIKTLINKEKENNDLDINLNSPLDNYINIGVLRNSGFWEYKTSLVLGKEPKLKYKEYSINIIPNIDLAKNKVENLKWSEVLKINPEAIDIVYSPEKNFFIIIDKEYLYFYNSFRRDPLTKIKMEDSDKSIIRYDWILGTNADLWEENFLLVGNGIEG